MSSQLNTQIQQLSTAVTNLILMSKVVWNTAQLVTYTTNGFGSPQYRAGGYIDGLGTETSDSNLIRASRGEMVMNARAVRSLGRGFFDQLNTGAPIRLPTANDNSELLAEMKALRAEVARLTVMTGAGAQQAHEDAGVIAAGQADTAKAITLQGMRKSA